MRKEVAFGIVGIASVALVSTAAITKPSGHSIMSVSPPASLAAFCGTVIALHGHGCIGVSSGIGGMQQLYDITGTSPRPAIGELVTGSGVVGGFSICHAGTHLNNVQWSRATACPLN